MGAFIQRHFANLRHIRNIFRIDPRAERGTGQIAPWLSGVVQLVHPAFPGAFQFNNPEVRVFPAPAPGAQFTIVVPPNELWLVRSLRVILVTDVTVIGRILTLELNDSVNIFFRVPGGGTVNASQTRGHTFADFGYQTASADFVQGLPPMFLATGWRIKSNVSSIQAADQLSDQVLLLEVFPI